MTELETLIYQPLNLLGRMRWNGMEHVVGTFIIMITSLVSHMFGYRRIAVINMRYYLMCHFVVAAYSTLLCLDEILIGLSDYLRMSCGESFSSKKLNWKLTALVEVFFQCSCESVELHIHVGWSFVLACLLLALIGAN